MSLRRRSAKRYSDHPSARQTATQELPQLDRAFVISFLQIDPDVAAVLNGEVPAPPVVTTTPLEHGSDLPREFEIVRSGMDPSPDRVRPEPTIIEAAASVVPVPEPEPEVSTQRTSRVSRVSSSSSNKRASKPRKVHRQPVSRRRAATPPPAEKHSGALEELLSPERPAEWAAAAATETQPAPPPWVAPEVPPAPQPVTAVQEVPPPSPVVPPKAAEPRRLPVQYVDHEKLMVQVAQVGWKVPAVRRMQWDCMNFVMPPSPMANMTPKQQSRQEWRNMLKYYRINPYKSHWRQDRKEAKRLLSQLRRARLDVA